jgi:hypothetical protein
MGFALTDKIIVENTKRQFTLTLNLIDHKINNEGS